ncbi:ribonuclease HIII [Tetragenococcus osmophilus]|uniref:Ribonuclease HIII n=1 Tax=Tetragenococcus osmophilus TaxID=526944 RepID=A0AA37XIH3_9ENTE|nr:ribonuclease HIII [Tetragenococcus osmophilus]AYW46965.1 ribonuclease HIII [Tetragenococcus osmophilus]GMA55007.1 ribonuclease HIII [Alicyclobacillus contaminans]GMA71208.1 ribonuclease HIII [Tetragenococcus osmophilus]
MGTTVIKLTSQKLKEARQYYASYIKPRKIPYASFFAKKDNITITAYNSGKIMFQGDNEEQEASLWQNNQSNKPKKERNLPENFAQKSIIGSDEVGNGSYFGPLVVCAVYASKNQLPTLKKLGVKDSKMLNDKQILDLAPKIKELVFYQELVVMPQKYNQIQPDYNAVRMKVALHNQCLHLLLEKIFPQQPEAILIDQFAQEATYRKYLKKEKNPVTQNLYFITKGEQYHLAVAAASIICRAEFLQKLDQLSFEIGLTLPSGAGEKSDKQAAKIIKQAGVESLGHYAKLHFKNTEKAKKIANK